MVDLEYPRLELVIEHDIEAEKVAAEVRLLGLARAIQVCQLRLHDEQRLHHNLLNLVPYAVCTLSKYLAVGLGH